MFSIADQYFRSRFDPLINELFNYIRLCVIFQFGSCLELFFFRLSRMYKRRILRSGNSIVPMQNPTTAVTSYPYRPCISRQLWQPYSSQHVGINVVDTSPRNVPMHPPTGIVNKTAIAKMARFLILTLFDSSKLMAKQA